MGCKTSKSPHPAEPVKASPSADEAVGGNKTSEEVNNNIVAPGDNKPADTTTSKDNVSAKGDATSKPAAAVDNLSKEESKTSGSPVVGFVEKAEIPAKSHTLIEQERRRLSVSTISRESPIELEPIKPIPIAVTNFNDPALELVERDRGVIREVTVDMIDNMLGDTASRVMVFGSPALEAQKGFDNKNIEAIQGIVLRDMGYMCKKGHKPESPNQDDFFVMKVNGWSFYGVFDGHGPCGHDVSHFVHNTLPFLLVGDKKFESDPLATMKRAFRKVHHLLEAAAEQPNSQLDCTLSGSTGTLVVQHERKLYVAHVGDSRAVIARRGPEGKIVAMNLTSDHKPTRPDERRRIENAGGEVRRLQGDIPHRVFVKDRMYPGLAMSRAIGDTIGSSVGVIPDPDARMFELTEDDIFFTLCTDGVWEFVSSQQAIDLICRFPRDKVADAAEALASESWNRWIEEEDNVVDDITGMIVYL